jgi:hypothetical protein
MDVFERNGEDNAAHQESQPARPCASACRRAPAHDMVAFVDRFQERLEMFFGPRLGRRRDQHDGQARVFKAVFQGSGEPKVGCKLHDPLLHRPALLGQIIDHRRDDRVCGRGALLGDQDDSNPGVGKGVALAMGCESIVALFGCRHVRSRRL